MHTGARRSDGPEAKSGRMVYPGAGTTRAAPDIVEGGPVVSARGRPTRSARGVGRARRQEPRAGDALGDAGAVQQRGDAAVPELEAGAGDHREVEVHGGLG